MSRVFSREVSAYRERFWKMLMDLHHADSISVSGLSTKLIVDIILVTKDLFKAHEILTGEKLGY